MQQGGKFIDSWLTFVGKAGKLPEEMRPTNFEESKHNFNETQIGLNLNNIQYSYLLQSTVQIIILVQPDIIIISQSISALICGARNTVMNTFNKNISSIKKPLSLTNEPVLNVWFVVNIDHQDICERQHFKSLHCIYFCITGVNLCCCTYNECGKLL